MLPEEQGKINPIIVFGFDYNENATAAGPGTILRCRGAARLFQELRDAGEYPLVIVSPGRAPGVSAEIQPQTMAEMMRSVLHFTFGIPWPKIIIAGDQYTWGTKAELLAATNQTRRWEQGGFAIQKAYLVSNRLHLLRISVLADRAALELNVHLEWRYAPVQWDLPSWGLKERIKEFCKFCVELAAAVTWYCRFLVAAPARK